MLTLSALPIIAAALVIGALVVLLAATRKPLSGPDKPIGDGTSGEGGYPSGFWVSVGIAIGVGLGLLLGLIVNSVIGGISIGIGVGLLLGKWLDQRYDRDARQYTDEQKHARRREAWGLIVMILLILATLAAALLPLLD